MKWNRNGKDGWRRMRGASSGEKSEREEMEIKYVEREQLTGERERESSERAGRPQRRRWRRRRRRGSVCGALLMWWHNDDGVDDSPLVGNQREERIIIKQLNFSAISPRQRQPLQGSSLRLIWEACGIWRTSEQLCSAVRHPHSRWEKKRRRGMERERK